MDALYAPRRTVLDAALAEAAEHAGAAFDFGSRVTGLHRSTTGASMASSSPPARGRATWRLGLVIGATAVARWSRSRPARRRSSAGTPARTCTAIGPACRPGATNGCTGPGLSAGLIPTGDGLTCVFVGGAPQDMAAAAAAHGGPAPGYPWLAGRIGLAERLDAATRVESVRYVRALPPAYLRRAHGEGWALVGDAGHWLDPMSTHGMTSALRDAISSPGR